jgi:hypothetical protein
VLRVYLGVCSFFNNVMCVCDKIAYCVPFSSDKNSFFLLSRILSRWMCCHPSHNKILTCDVISNPADEADKWMGPVQFYTAPAYKELSESFYYSRT